MTPDEYITLASRYRSAAEATRDPTARLQIQVIASRYDALGKGLEVARHSKVTVARYPAEDPSQDEQAGVGAG